MAPPSKPPGKFKPRKPGKKIQIGMTAASHDLTSNNAASSTAPPTRTGGRSRSPGKRGGRRRSPVQLPRGDVFFTGNTDLGVADAPTRGAVVAPTTTSLARASAGDSKAPGARHKRRTTTGASKAVSASEEIVVGELERGVGSQLQQSSQEAESKDNQRKIKEEDDEEEPLAVHVVGTRRQNRRNPSSDQLMMDTYDSDTSEEQDASPQDASISAKHLLPTELPFPISSAPLGIGEADRPVLYSRQGTSVLSPSASPPTSRPSPFVDLERPQHRRAEEDSWFLFQFPTRMPDLQQAVEAPEVVKSDGTGEQIVPTPDTSRWGSADVAIPSTVNSGFDNALTKAPSGRLGKLVVYRSGRTVLILGGGSSGAPEIHMNVDEGLPCGFVQQAVVVDTEEGNYVNLGDVKKTVVVTPDIDQAFPLDCV